MYLLERQQLQAQLAQIIKFAKQIVQQPREEENLKETRTRSEQGMQQEETLGKFKI